jgi:hypothetical protein
MATNDNHPIGQWLYEHRADGLYRRRIGFKPVWERCIPEREGAQTLIPGVAPVTDGDRARYGSEQLLQPSCAQRPADDGLFDLGARRQQQLL